MELKACIEAMVFACMTGEKNVEILTDSAYVVNCVKDKWYVKWVKNGWFNSRNEAVKNRDLWEVFIKLLDFEDGFKFTHVKGHAGDKWNELADLAAKAACKKG